MTGWPLAAAFGFLLLVAGFAIWLVGGALASNADAMADPDYTRARDDE